MEFNWINIFNGIIVVLMLIPNIIYAVKNNDKSHNKSGTAARVIEQISRYACIFLMIFPIFVWEFGFSPLEYMFLYLIGNVILLVMYFVVWGLYFKSKTKGRALALAIIPALIFMNSAVCVKHWALLAVAAVFVISHVYVTAVEQK